MLIIDGYKIVIHDADGEFSCEARVLGGWVTFTGWDLEELTSNFREVLEAHQDFVGLDH